MDFEYSVKADIVSDVSVKYKKRGRVFFVEPQTERESFCVCLCPTDLEIIVDMDGQFITGLKGKLTPKDRVVKGDISLPQCFDGKVNIVPVDSSVLKDIKFVAPFIRHTVYDSDKRAFMFGKIPNDSITVRVNRNLFITIGDDKIEAVTVTGI